MNEAPKELNLIPLSRAIRFGFAVLVAGVSYPNIRLALYVPKFERMLLEMLGDKPLPAATSFLIHAQYFLICTSILIPLIAIALVFTSGIIRPLYIAGTLLIAAFVQLFITWDATVSPITSIATSMSAP